MCALEWAWYRGSWEEARVTLGKSLDLCPAQHTQQKNQKPNNLSCLAHGMHLQEVRHTVGAQQTIPPLTSVPRWP